MHMGWKAWVVGSFMATGAAAGCGGAEPVDSSESSLATGAVYTTFDAARGGCLDSPNGINCNRYTSVDKVHLSGGPRKGGLENGDYFFAIIRPGDGKSALSDGDPGNLSGVAGSVMSERRFSISDGQIEPGSHHPSRGNGRTPNGQYALQAAPFSTSSNPGGVYVLAICRVGAVGPKDCLFDNFKVEPGCGSSDSGEGLEAKTKPRDCQFPEPSRD